MQHTMTKMNDDMQIGVENCQACHAACLKTISLCLEMGDDHAEVNHIKLLQDCVQICQTSADFMLRMSNFHPQVCAVCADICNACAKSCESLSEQDSDFMHQCAQACLQCSQSCRNMVAM